MGSLPTKSSFSSMEVNVGSGHSSGEWPAPPTNGAGSNPGSPKVPARRPAQSISRPLPTTQSFSPVLAGLKRAPSAGAQDHNGNGGLARKSSASWSVPSNSNSKPSTPGQAPTISVQEAINEVMHDDYAAKSGRDEKSKKV